MEALHHAVTVLVEESTKADEDPALTFERIRALAYAARDGREPVSVRGEAAPGRNRPPRLTEPWFC